MSSETHKGVSEKLVDKKNLKASMIQATPLRTVHWIVVNDDMILIYIAPPQHISLVYLNNLN